MADKDLLPPYRLINLSTLPISIAPSPRPTASYQLDISLPVPSDHVSIGSSTSGINLNLPKYKGLKTGDEKGTIEKTGRWTRLKLDKAGSAGLRKPRVSKDSESSISGKALLSDTGPASSSKTSCEKLPIRVFTKQGKGGQSIVLVLPISDTTRHLSTLPDDTCLGDLVLPGTHETLALYGWPISQCQESDCTLTTQLAEGIRFFDIRLAIRKGVLLAYHGSFPQRTPFRVMLEELSAFLEMNKLETFVMCIQQEAPSNPDFSAAVRREMDKYIERGEWFLENKLPTLGQVRGKGILMSRFGGGSSGSNSDGGAGSWEVQVRGPDGRMRREERMGWKPNRWPNSVVEGFVWDCGLVQARTQDWYDIYGFFNIPAKMNVVAEHLSTSSLLPRTANLTISFTSASGYPLAPPPWVANGFGWPRWGLGWRGMNSRMRDWLLDMLEEESGGGKEERVGRLRGIVPMDYYRKEGLVEIMLAFNRL